MNRSKLPTEARQAALVAAALARAAERSPASVTTADLAQAVGITQDAVFHHFERKEAIWLAVIDFAHQDVLGRLHAAAAGGAARGVHGARGVCGGAAGRAAGDFSGVSTRRTRRSRRVCAA